MQYRYPKHKVLTGTLICFCILALAGYLLRLYDQYSQELLKKARNAYVRAAAREKIGWHAWEKNAVETAVEQNKLIYLDIGAWANSLCFNMSSDVYDDSDIADLMAMYYIPIKVDADFRPELASLFSSLAVMSKTEYKSDLPVIVVLTPKLDVIYASGAMTRNKMLMTLQNLAHRWASNSEKIANAARDFTQMSQGDNRILPIGRNLDDIDWSAWARQIGGFLTSKDILKADANQSPYLLEALLYYSVRVNDMAALQQVEQSLNFFAASTLRDPVNGGFFVGYSNLPQSRFACEKTLRHNIAWLRIYSLAYQQFKNPAYREVALEIIRFLHENLWNEQKNAFSASLRGGVKPNSEGEFYLWLPSDIKQLCEKKEVPLAYACLNLQAPKDIMGEQPVNVVVVNEPESVAAALGLSSDEARAMLANIFAKMRLKRQKSSQKPHADETYYTALNAMTASALAVSSRCLNDATSLKTAKRLVRELRAKSFKADGSVLHSLDSPEADYYERCIDYTALAKALLDMREFTGETKLIAEAEQLMNQTIKLFEDSSNSGFFSISPNTGADWAPLIPLKDASDEFIPSANAFSVEVFQTLWMVTRKPMWQAKAKSSLTAVLGISDAHFFSAGSLYKSALLLKFPPRQIVLVGNPNHPDVATTYDAALNLNPLLYRIAYFPSQMAPTEFRNYENGGVLVDNHAISAPFHTAEQLMKEVSKPFLKN